MKNTWRGAIGLLVALSGAAVQAQHVVPMASAALAGGGTFLGPLANAQRTYQLLIHSDQLTPLVGSDLTGLTFRLLPSATAVWPAADVAFANYDIRLSASVEPAARSTTFANNVVGAQSLVRSGALTIPAGSFAFGSSPNAFGHVITFAQPYAYAGGHLLVEIRHQGFTGTSASVDSVLATNTTAGYSTQFSGCWTSNYAGVTGAQANFAVVQFISEAGGGCYPDCDGVGGLTANDFACFLNSYTAGDSYANCDGVGGLTANDFACFLNSYTGGCS